MTKTIWKFTFDTADEVYIEMPKGAQILSLQTQNGVPCLWAIVDPDEALKTYAFRVYGTGHPLPTYGPDDYVKGTFIGTYQLHNGALVFHMFAMGGPQ